jgi:hypothetical protein
VRDRDDGEAVDPLGDLRIAQVEARLLRVAAGHLDRCVGVKHLGRRHNDWSTAASTSAVDWTGSTGGRPWNRSTRATAVMRLREIGLSSATGVPPRGDDDVLAARDTVDHLIAVGSQLSHRRLGHTVRCTTGDTTATTHPRATASASIPAAPVRRPTVGFVTTDALLAAGCPSRRQDSASRR